MMVERNACRRTSGTMGRGALTGMTAFLLAGFLIADGPVQPTYAADPARIFAPTYAADPAHIFATEGESVQHVTIVVNKSRTLRMDRPFSNATVGSGEIADTLPLSDRSLYIQGKKTGTTNISIFDPTARLIGIIDLEVTPDVGNLQQKIRSSTGSSGIRVSSSQGQIILSGVAVDAVAADRAMAVARSLAGEKGEVVNAMEVAPTQQVLLEVRFLEASRSVSRELGVNLFVANRSGSRGINTGLGRVTGAGRIQAKPDGSPLLDDNKNPVSTFGNVPIISAAGTLLSGGSAFGTALATVLQANGMTIDALITALEEKGLVRRLAEPNLMALSGDRARFLAGGQIPVPVPQPGGIGATIAIEWKPFGVELVFTPTVLSRGVINLRVNPSVSELDFANAVQISGFLVPALTSREAQTVVELRDGQSFAIAGLLQSVNQRNISQLPWIGSVPVLGALFRSSQFQQNETDLVVIVTPRLASPAAPGQRLASPLDSRLPSNDVDFFLNGQPEVKKRYTDFVSSGGGLEGPYGHMLRPEVGLVGTGAKPSGARP
jgi:pilus assembly protein CpaC